MSISYHLEPVPPKESERLIAELRAWCDAEYGRRAEVARALNKSPQLISDWLAGRAKPRLDDAFELRAFLKKQRKPK
jgi:transcriptional regulator with XRE-family HTH domain